MALPGGVYPRSYYTIYEMGKDVERWIKETPGPNSLNCGSLCDALAISSVYLFNIVPLFRRTNKNLSLTVLTKAGSKTPAALDILGAFGAEEPCRNVNYCWTLNSDATAARYEAGAPSPTERLELAKMFSDRGWPIRYRIDPMFPLDGWKEDYTKLIQVIAANGTLPKMITLGTLREGNGLAKLTENLPHPPFKEMRHFMEDKWDKGIKKRRMKKDIRTEMYKHLVSEIRKYLGDIPIGLCKEEHDVIEEVLGKTKVHVCNCQHTCFIRRLEAEKAKIAKATAAT
tara:strand:+ start:442 stop:1296 length:855 start_codon:yes stop_codon:yes gene_type:complete